MRFLVSRKAAFLLALTVLACSDIKAPDPVKLTPSEMLYKVRFGTRALMITANDTITLKVSAQFADSSRRSIDPVRANWRSIDSDRVSVDSTGKIKAGLASSLPTNIIVAFTHNGITRHDTIAVYVTATRLDANEVRLIVLDSTRVGSLNQQRAPRVRVDLYKDGELFQEAVQLPVIPPSGIITTPLPITGFPGMFEYSVVNSKSILGRFMIHVSLNLYGNDVKDSVEFTGLYPTEFMIIMGRDADGEVVAGKEIEPGDPMQYMQPCGIIKFLIISPVKGVDLIFSDSVPTGTETCLPLPNSAANAGFYLLGANQVFGNVLNIPTGFVMIMRRSATLGEVSYYVRDAATKERLKISGKYYQKEPDKTSSTNIQVIQ